MTGFSEVEREEIAVQFVRVTDALEEIGRAWSKLEAAVALRGRHFYGAYDPIADDYRACVEVREGDELVPSLESETLPGGRYLRARLRGDPPGVYERCYRSRACRSSRAAASGSSASRIARTTATPGAPAAATSATLDNSMPPIANQGMVKVRAAAPTSQIPEACASGFVGVAKIDWTPT
jgi:hypothetical protein